MQRQNRVHMVTVLISLLAFGSQLGMLSPHQVQGQQLNTSFQYAVKITCSLLATAGDGFLANGTYRTVINIHNPTEERVTFAEKVVIANPIGSEPGAASVTPFMQTVIGPNAGAVIDCGTVAGFFCPIELNGGTVCIDFGFIDGFVVINSPVELDVVAVYTARPPAPEGTVSTMDVEHIPVRKIDKVIEVKQTQPTRRLRQDMPPSQQ